MLRASKQVIFRSVCPGPGMFATFQYRSDVALGVVSDRVVVLEERIKLLEADLASRLEADLAASVDVRE